MGNVIPYKRSNKTSNWKPENQIFRFEGSMIESIENFITGFNPNPITYMKIRKNKLEHLTTILKKSQLLISSNVRLTLQQN
ncbi:MAG: hypothetical protein COA58_10470 [Bacteroidetes bacterium]|nr:MAG: hypothetical protein COA58_10470 [Bacteroidota bacterium]